MKLLWLLAISMNIVSTMYIHLCNPWLLSAVNWLGPEGEPLLKMERPCRPAHELS